MRVIVKTDLVHVEINEGTAYNPDVADDLLTRVCSTALRATEILAAIFPDGDD